MSPALWMALGASVPVVLVGLFLSGRVLLRGGAGAGDAHSREVAQLRAELEELRAELAATRVARNDVPAGSPTADYVITTAEAPDAGRSADRSAPPPAEPVPDRVVLSATLGEPLVKLAALAYGVRHALSPRTRNRIAFEMRREVKRSRKERRRASRRARLRAAEVEDAA